jgi:hypothetical protein
MAKRPLDKSAFFNAVKKEFGDIATITRQEVILIERKYGIDYPVWFIKDKARHVSRGV